MNLTPPEALNEIKTSGEAACLLLQGSRLAESLHKPWSPSSSEAPSSSFHSPSAESSCQNKSLSGPWSESQFSKRQCKTIYHYYLKQLPNKMGHFALNIFLIVPCYERCTGFLASHHKHSLYFVPHLQAKRQISSCITTHLEKPVLNVQTRLGNQQKNSTDIWETGTISPSFFTCYILRMFPQTDEDAKKKS